MDMLDWQYTRSKKNIDNPVAVLRKVLETGINPPEDWIPSNDRESLKRKEALNKKNDNLRLVNQKNEFLKAEHKLNSLSAEEYKLLHQEAIKEVPDNLKSMETFIRIKMRERLMTET